MIWRCFDSVPKRIIIMNLFCTRCSRARCLSKPPSTLRIAIDILFSAPRFFIPIWLCFSFSFVTKLRQNKCNSTTTSLWIYIPSFFIRQNSFVILTISSSIYYILELLFVLLCHIQHLNVSCISVWRASGGRQRQDCWRRLIEDDDAHLRSWRCRQRRQLSKHANLLIFYFAS